MATMDIREAGRMGGLARAKKLTRTRRVEIAKKAVRSRKDRQGVSPKKAGVSKSK